MQFNNIGMHNLILSANLHADNGGPMKGSMMHATFQKPGAVPSFSRPRNSV